MSSIAGQTLFHPSVSQILRVWSTTNGRDKTYSTLQFFARFYAWFLLRRGGSANKLAASQWNALKAALGSGRKMMRIGKPLEFLQGALTTASSPSSYQFEQCSSVARLLCYAGYLTLDSIQWAHSVKFVSLKKGTAAKVDLIAHRFWLAAIVFSIGSGASKLNRQVSSLNQLKRSSTTSSEKGDDAQPAQDAIRALKVQSAAVRYQLIMDLLDVWLPAAGLGYVGVNEGLASAMGLVSNAMAFNLQWKAAGLKK
ncbi:Peroxisomal membrane protein PMP27 [Tulasnella sp. 330]|nr:Peroxisomal membrane protein PMP27 [Tulasnella sp. 330]KAG8882536.1 Peroxisomal membrane protein PMP27 [Tulasnella sp. 332]KAG8883809.1 Peroxisomal membrane protein PMP27 [Tulasnella sp. 331]